MFSVTTKPGVCLAGREPVIERLKRGYVEGRLDNAELELRVGLALTAQTRLELERLVNDLPRAGAHGGAGALSVRRRTLRSALLITIVAMIAAAVIAYLEAALIAAGMSLHLIQ